MAENSALFDFCLFPLAYCLMPKKCIFALPKLE